MCALFGYLDCGKKIPHKILQKLVQALANASEERGDHASGIAYKNVGKLTIYKRPRPAHKMKFRIPKGTTSVMGIPVSPRRGIRRRITTITRSMGKLNLNLPSLTMAFCTMIENFKKKNSSPKRRSKPTAMSPCS